MTGEKTTYLDLLYSALRKHYDNEFRTGVHVSDITLCPRKAVWRRLNPQPITNKELNFFTSGSAIHHSIQLLAEMVPNDYETDQYMKENWSKIKNDLKKNGNRFEIEKEVMFEGIPQGHVDIYDTKNNIPIECKSARVKTVEKPKPFHVQQLKSYMAMLGADTGIVLYQCLMNFGDNPFVEFEIKMTVEERKIHMNWLKAMYSDFEKAEKAKDHKLAINIINDSNLNWLCKDRDGNTCPLYDECMGVKK